MIIELVRIKSTKAFGTIGIIKVDGVVNFWSLELGYKNNEQDISCIPLGTYKVSNHVSPKFGECLKVENVPKRTDILMHSGNNINDTKGCILIGNGVEENMKSECTVQDSRKALVSLLSKTKNAKDITLKVIEI